MNDFGCLARDRNITVASVFNVAVRFYVQTTASATERFITSAGAFNFAKVSFLAFSSINKEGGEKLEGAVTVRHIRLIFTESLQPNE